MAIIEQETVETEVLTEQEQRARTLEAAALEIEVNGWTRGAFGRPNGTMCMVGGIAAALGIKIGDPNRDVWSKAKSVWGSGVTWWDEEYDRASDIIDFNDDFAKSADEVTFVLRWRAQEIRDGLL